MEEPEIGKNPEVKSVFDHLTGKGRIGWKSAKVMKSWENLKSNPPDFNRDTKMGI